MRQRIAAFGAYPLPKDPNGPFDATVTSLFYDKRGRPFPVTIRARWLLSPTLHDFAVYILHPKP